VLWIGGPPRSGKTTVATRIASRHGLRWYNADTRTWAHRDRALEMGSPAAIRWEELTPEERWAGPPAELLALSLHHERGPMVVDDLLALPRSPLVVAEGSTLPAARVPPGAPAVWLLPTREFQRARLDERGHGRGPRELAFLLAETIEGEVNAAGVPSLVVDGTLDVEAIVAAVEELFAEPLARGPRAETAAERCALLREANESVVGQVRAYFARPWAEGDPDDVVRTFLCECGDSACVQTVEARVGAAADQPVLAAAHA
jgi:hypothetical protein